MNIFIFGQKSFGKAVLERLYSDGHAITGVAPPPNGLEDKMAAFAISVGVPIIGDCSSITPNDIPEKTDLVISAHSHWFISEGVLNKCKFGGIGFHPSLLPRHRGKDAIRWTIHMGDAVTGGTIYNLRSDICDGGDILLQRHILVDPEWDYHELWRNIFPLGVDMVSDAVKLVESNNMEWKKQDERLATWEPSWERPKLHRG